MNKQRREDLDRAIELLEEAKAIVDSASDDERDGFDNMPEGLQASENGERMEQAAETLCMALDDFDTLVETITEAKGE